MDDKVKKSGSAAQQNEDKMGIRKGPWTLEEDHVLVSYVPRHGEARFSGLKGKTGNSCRVRRLNYLRPTVRRGNITLQEQLLILELHSLRGNRWSKIAGFLPRITDSEIKKYWRTRVIIKQAKLLQCGVESKEFKDNLRYLWMPRLVRQIRAASNTVQVQEQSGWSQNAERLPRRIDNEIENHWRGTRLAGKEKMCEFKVNDIDNDLECSSRPLCTETSDEKDSDRRSDSNSDEYSGPS